MKIEFGYSLQYFHMKIESMCLCVKLKYEITTPKKKQPETTMSKRTAAKVEDIKNVADNSEDIKTQAVDEPNVKNKKQKLSKPIIRMIDFDFDKDVIFLPMQKRDGFNSIKVYNKHTDGPLLLSFTGGGFVNKKFGVSPNMFGNLTVTFDLNNAEEYEACNRLHVALCNYAIKNRKQWFPECTGSDELLRECANKTVAAPKQKKDADGMWNAKFKAMTEENSGMPNAAGKRVFNAKSTDGTQISNLMDLSGRKWEKAVVEISSIYTGNKHSFGLSKRMRAIKVLPSQDLEEIECSDSDESSSEIDNE